LLALQCSDNTIRLYQLNIGPLTLAVSSQSPLDPSKTAGSEFLIPLRLLRDHTTGGQWPIRISFRHGPLYRITTAQSTVLCDPSRVPTSAASSDPVQGRAGGVHHSSASHVTGLRLSPKQLIRVRATDASDLISTVTSDDNQLPAQGLYRQPTLKPSTNTLLSDDVSVSSDVSESVGQGSTQLSRGVVQSKASEDQDDRDGGTVSAEDYLNDERTEEGEDESGVIDDDDDSGDEETHLNMMAGLATSSLLTSNMMDSIPPPSLRQSSRLVKGGDEMIAEGKIGQLSGGTLQKQSAVTNWESSFVLATGSNNGQVSHLSVSLSVFL
jgi:hypothetical protein